MPFWLFPCARWNPYFCSVWWLWMVRNKCHFPKTDSCNENARFVPSEHKLFFFWKMPFLFKKVFSSQPPKNTVFLVCFLKFSFSFFHIFSSASSKIKRRKPKMHSFFGNPFSWHLDNLPKIFSHPYTLLFFRPPKNTKKKKNKQKNLGLIFNATLDRFSTQKRINLGQIFNSTTYIYI